MSLNPSLGSRPSSQQTQYSSAASPLAVHPPTSYVIIPSSHPSSLQIYSPKSQELISELEISPSNRVSRRDETYVEPSCVTHLAVSHDGEWMATIDRRRGLGNYRIGTEVTLKIWKWTRSNGAGMFELNTRIDRPHDKGRVTSMSFAPSRSDSQEHILLTTGENGSLRLWGVETQKGSEHDEETGEWTPERHCTLSDIPGCMI